jgi:hypothetical protein
MTQDPTVIFICGTIQQRFDYFRSHCKQVSVLTTAFAHKKIEQDTHSQTMPRTKSSKQDTRTPAEKLEGLDSIADRLIFFNYYDGITTNGLVGFSLANGPAGSVKHKRILRSVTLATSKQQILQQLRMTMEKQSTIKYKIETLV